MDRAGRVKGHHRLPLDTKILDIVVQNFAIKAIALAPDTEQTCVVYFDVFEVGNSFSHEIEIWLHFLRTVQVDTTTYCVFEKLPRLQFKE